MYKYLTKNSTFCYLDVKNKHLTGYNSVHFAIGMPTSKVNPSNIFSVKRKVNSLGATIPHGRVKLKVGDLVTITKEKVKFAKGENIHVQQKYLGLSRLFSACFKRITNSDLQDRPIGGQFYNYEVCQGYCITQNRIPNRENSAHT